MSCFSASVTRRGVFMLAAGLGLSGCGFHPLYAPRGPQDWDPDLAAITVASIRDRAGQILALALRENLNPGGVSVPARWRLETSLTISRVDLGIQRNATAISSEITINVSYVVTDIKTGQSVYTSTSRASGDFDRLNDAYATQVAGDDAQERALHQVAEEIALRMALFVRQQRAKRASP